MVNRATKQSNNHMKIHDNVNCYRVVDNEELCMINSAKLRAKKVWYNTLTYYALISTLLNFSTFRINYRKSKALIKIPK